MPESEDIPIPDQVLMLNILLEKKMDKAIRKNWYKSYNKASDEFNSKIGELNRTFGKDVYIENPKYVRAAGKLWTDSYSKYLISDFGADPLTGSKDWVKNAPFMNMYDDYIEK